jgi:hypothetical protein
VRIKTTKDFPQISQIHVKVPFKHGYTIMLEMVTITSRNISWMQPMKQLNMTQKGIIFSLEGEGVWRCIFLYFFTHTISSICSHWCSPRFWCIPHDVSQVPNVWTPKVFLVGTTFFIPYVLPIFSHFHLYNKVKGEAHSLINEINDR